MKSKVLLVFLLFSFCSLPLVSAQSETPTETATATPTENAANNSGISQKLGDGLAYLESNIEKKPETDISGPVDQRSHEEDKVTPNAFAIVFYKPTYILPFYYTKSPYYAVYQNNTPNNEKLMHTEMKYQLSFKVPIWKNIFGKPSTLNLAYTQLSYWQAYNRTAFFRETDYEPELFLENKVNLRFFKFWTINSLNLGAVHQSNGFGGSMERSWNRIYLELITSTENWMLSVKPWYVIHDSTYQNHNPDLVNFLGHGQVILACKYKRNVFSIMARNLIENGARHASAEIAWSFPLTLYLSGYVQFFSGYGQSLIEYNHHTNSLGVGFALSNWI